MGPHRIGHGGIRLSDNRPWNPLLRAGSPPAPDIVSLEPELLGPSSSLSCRRRPTMEFGQARRGIGRHQTPATRRIVAALQTCNARRRPCSTDTRRKEKKDTRKQEMLNARNAGSGGIGRR